METTAIEMRTETMVNGEGVPCGNIFYFLNEVDADKFVDDWQYENDCRFYDSGDIWNQRVIRIVNEF